MLEVGKLYSCSEYFLGLFPDKEAAAAAVPAAASGAAAVYAAYWSKKFDKPVSYCNHLTPLLVLSVNEKYVEVLAGDKVGWIINEYWSNIKEIVNEAA
jgi:hypothetical protein